MIHLLQNPYFRFKPDYSQQAFKTKRVLRIEWKKGYLLTDLLLQDIIGHKCEILAYLNKEVLKLPPPFAQAVAVISTRRTPRFMNQRNWEQVLLSLSGLLSGNPSWLHQIINHGWSITDIFGCHPISPDNRIDYKGLLLLMRDKEIVSVSRECIVSKTKFGATQTYRRPFLPMPEQTTLDLLPKEESL